MAKLPYFPCYARDVLSSSKIALMSGEAFKAYWLLLCASWLEDERATLPNNEAKLEALARVGASTWLEIKNEVLACFDTAGNGRLFSPRLLEVSLLQEKRREAGSKGGSKTQANPQANFKQNLKHQSQSSELELEAKTYTEKKITEMAKYTKLAQSFLEQQKEHFPKESALIDDLEGCVIDGARKLSLYHTKNNWTEEEIQEVLEWILEDTSFWQAQIRTLGGIRNRKKGKGNPMKFENARASMERSSNYIDQRGERELREQTRQETLERRLESEKARAGAATPEEVREALRSDIKAREILEGKPDVS